MNCFCRLHVILALFPRDTQTSVHLTSYRLGSFGLIVFVDIRELERFIIGLRLVLFLVFFFFVPQRSSRTLYNFQESFHYKCNCLFKMRRIGHQNLLKIQTGYFGTKDAFNCSVSYKISNRFQMVWLDRFAYDPAMIVPLLGALFRLFLSYRLPKGFCMGIALATTDIQISWAQINPDVSVGKRCRTKRNQNVAQSKTTQ